LCKKKKKPVHNEKHFEICFGWKKEKGDMIMVVIIIKLSSFSHHPFEKKKQMVIFFCKMKMKNM